MPCSSPPNAPWPPCSPGPPGAENTNTEPANPTTDDGKTNDHELGGSGAGAVANGSAVGLALLPEFPRGQLSLQPWPVSLPFPAPARQTVHAVLPHTAYRRSSPAAFDFPSPKRPGRDDDPIKADQAQMVLRSQHLGHPPSPSSAAFAPFGQPQREPGQGIVADLAEHQCGVAEAEIPRPAAQEQVEFLHDPLDRHQQTGSSRDRPNPIPCVLDRLTRRPTTEENQVRRPGSPPAHQPIVEAQEIHSRTAFDQMHDAGLGCLGLQPEITQQDRQPLQSGLGLFP